MNPTGLGGGKSGRFENRAGKAGSSSRSPNGRCACASHGPPVKCPHDSPKACILAACALAFPVQERSLHGHGGHLSEGAFFLRRRAFEGSSRRPFALRAPLWMAIGGLGGVSQSLPLHRTPSRGGGKCGNTEQVSETLSWALFGMDQPTGGLSRQKGLAQLLGIAPHVRGKLFRPAELCACQRRPAWDRTRRQSVSLVQRRVV